MSVDRDELDLGDPGVDHPVDRVQAGAADPDDADDREVRGRLAPRRTMEARRRLRQRLEMPHGGRLGQAVPEVQGLGLGLGLGLRCRLRFGLRRGLEERRGVLDRLLERLFGRRRLLLLYRGRIGLALLGLPLCCLGRPEELGERALTHAGASSRH